jgi:repressor LexA
MLSSVDLRVRAESVTHGLRSPTAPIRSLTEASMPLTKRQKEILDFLETFVADNGYPPSFEEIARHFGYGSLATVHEHLENLRAKGYIRKSFNASRSIELVRGGPAAAVELPLLGNVAAGVPIEAIEEQETIAVPEDLLARGGQHYVLRVRGDSMIEEQIKDGDYVIVNARSVAQNGDMVVALVDGESATVKKFYRDGDGRIRLQPANAMMPPMFFKAGDVMVQGIVVGVIRRC